MIKSLKNISGKYILDNNIPYSEESLTLDCREYLENEYVDIELVQKIFGKKIEKNFFINEFFQKIKYPMSYARNFYNLTNQEVNTLLFYSKDLFGVIIYLIYSREILQGKLDFNGIWWEGRREEFEGDLEDTGQNLKMGIELMKKYPYWYKEHLKIKEKRYMPLFDVFKNTTFDTLRIIGENSIMTDEEFCEVFCISENFLNQDVPDGTFIMIIYNHFRSVFKHKDIRDNLLYLFKRGMYLNNNGINFIERNLRCYYHEDDPNYDFYSEVIKYKKKVVSQ